MNESDAPDISDQPSVNLLFVVPSLAFGGAERQLLELLRTLADRPYRTTVVYLTGYRFPGEQGFYEAVGRLPNVELMPIARDWKYDLLSPLMRLVTIIHMRDIEVVVGYLNLGAMLAILAGRLTGRPVIADSIRDCAPDRRPVLWICRRIQAWLADVLVSNSRAGFLVRFRYNRANFKVIPNGIDPSRFEAPQAELQEVRRRLGLGQFTFLVGMVASLTPYKDHEAFLAAAKLVSENRPDVGFVLVGDGPRRAVLEHRCQQLGLGARLVFTGARNDADKITQVLDVAVLLTNHRVIQEGLSNAVLEAMACGKPVIATYGGGTPEIITDGDTGFLVRDNDIGDIVSIILRLLMDDPLRQAVGTRAREIIAIHYSTNARRDAYESLFRSLARVPSGLPSGVRQLDSGGGVG